MGHVFWISFFHVYPDLSPQLIHCLAAPSQAMPHGFVFPIPVQPRRAVPKMDISGVGPMRAWPTSEQTADRGHPLMIPLLPLKQVWVSRPEIKTFFFLKSLRVQLSVLL